MPKKTFKIGEYCKGGVISVEINDDVITLIGKDWDGSTGYRKSSNQSNAKEFIRKSIKNGYSSYDLVYDFLIDLTTHYYTEEIIKWINSKIKLQ